MKRTIASFLTAMSLMLAGVCASAQDRTVYPEDNGKALVNPGMGWMLYYYSNVLPSLLPRI